MGLVRRHETLSQRTSLHYHLGIFFGCRFSPTESVNKLTSFCVLSMSHSLSIVIPLKSHKQDLSENQIYGPARRFVISERSNHASVN